jgi:hypothetical protein
MTKIYIAFYDDEDSGSRENWNTFHTPWVAATTREKAKQLAKDAIAASIAVSIKAEYGVDLATADLSKLDIKILNEIEYLENSMHIEIQEGKLQ